MKILRKAFPLIAALASVVFAQDKESDYVELSSFSVTGSADRGYTPQQAPRPNVAITLRKPATAVVMDVTIVNSSDKVEDKNREVVLAIRALERAVKAESGLKFERREIQLRGEARRKTIFSRSSITSYANVAVVAPLASDADLFALVDRMRGVIAKIPATNDTKVLDGAVYLMIERPEQFRKELLAAIFTDIAFLKENLSAGFEIMPTGLDGAIQVRAASEREVELWIDYKLTIRSLVELANPRPKN
ncbi:MAG: hypothetical protein HYV96_20120 [Opitutae bacterium]|nr:hypothetical protein [Opitutae bacterium]